MGTIGTALVAVALFIAQGAATTATATATGNATTTYLSIFDSDASPSGGSWLEYLGGSVVSVDWEHNATTLALNCLTSALANCSLASPATITNGPSTFASTLTYTSTITPDRSDASVDGYILATEYVYCNITSSTESALCYITETAWASIDSTTTTITTSVTSHLDSSYITYVPVPVTGGVEKLIATPNATATSSSPGITATNTPSIWISHSSKGWIGIVVGCVVGVALIAGGLYWLARRRNRRATGTASDDGDNAAGALSTKAELPNTGMSKTELAAGSTKAELPDSVAKTELAADATRAELASHEAAAELPGGNRLGGGRKCTSCRETWRSWRSNDAMACAMNE
ncbi:hypothetical protein BO70DRAFT_193728 [Aspergillus heteromorphus CBS 117.55]|uniref:Mid2 domain-containing protein n=1 Tax=Aspergillus heteromorphus CBS 117.55 TaxID=1448321 RepID=A0A317WLP7_9EURO|nr:uncharacterized protein BO70DRAFT_193728 [Aspergillus heteromorphus CBS 117.55]PWY87394.1 hypothetical protein BO70DRAFT_193728 [Aspergillus heteromorphus CBS 117.55]